MIMYLSMINQKALNIFLIQYLLTIILGLQLTNNSMGCKDWITLYFFMQKFYYLQTIHIIMSVFPWMCTLTTIQNRQCRPFKSKLPLFYWALTFISEYLDKWQSWLLHKILWWITIRMAAMNTVRPAPSIETKHSIHATSMSKNP